MCPAQPRTDDGQQADDERERPGAPGAFRQRAGPPAPPTLVVSTPPGPPVPPSPGEIVVSADGEIDGCTAPELLARLIDALHAAAGRTLVVDLRGVWFMGACGVTVLMAIRADALALGIPLAVVADQRAVLRPLQLTLAGDELAVHPTVEDARGTAPGPDRSATVQPGRAT